MKRLKKIAAVLLAAAIAVGTAACSTDKSWAVKNSTETVPVGVYIYNLYNAYQSAQSKVSDSSKPVLEQKVENESAETWIKSQALEYTKMVLLLDDKMKELKLSLTSDETKTVSSNTESGWSSVGTSLEKYGIAKTSYETANTAFSQKYQKVFLAIYGKNGTKAVSDAALKTYFEKNFSDFTFVVRTLYKQDSSGNYAALSDAEAKAAKKEFDGYAEEVRTGKKTMQQVADAYKTSSKQTEDQLGSATTNLNTSTSYPDDMVTTIQKMKNGEVKAVEISSMYYVIIQKNDIAKKTSSQLSSEDGRNAVLAQMKEEEYSTAMEKEAKAYSATVNQAVIDSYSPSMFVTTTSSEAASTETSTATEASSEASTSSAASSK
ncbi:MAG: hypothetical protein GX424_00395 [Clostridiales bacterium]|nr:hypothetical protein [Clostridiales bacterium]